MNIKHIDSYKKLGLNVAYYRKLKGFTQLHLAELIDKDITTIGCIELARTGVSLDVLFALAEVFEIPVYKLFEFRD
jgi:transcriptional regulator with XRE-family HTH domain